MGRKNRKKFSKEDFHWIRFTQQLALQGIGGASPNPYVGCVITKNNRVVGTGSHLKFGGPHAEVHALKKAGGKAKGAVLYSNLEPCCHTGKTPPCTQAILHSGIKKVVFSMSDPNPLVRGKGARTLKNAGIKVVNGLLTKESEDLNRSFLTYMQKKRPYVFLKSAASLDGKISTSIGESKWITSKKSRIFSHKVRSQMDAILVGAETVRKDNPTLTSHGKGKNPIRIVLSASGKIPKNSKIFNTQAPTWVIHSNRSLEKRFKEKRSHVDWIYCSSSNKKIAFKNVLKVLAQKGVSRLLIEGGGTVSAFAMESKLVDEVYYYVAPTIIGGQKARSAFEGRGFLKLISAPKLTHMTLKNLKPDILIQGRIQY